jgi:hypothetical protein
LTVIRHLLRDQPDLEAEEADTMTQARLDFENFKQEVYRQGMSRRGADDVLAVLKAKGIPVSPMAEQQIRSCSDLDTLHRWMILAVNATTAEDVLRAASS